MKQYNKLVRDKIPEIIKRNGQSCEIIKLDYQTYVKELNNKLNEEVAEYQKDNNVEELADIVEVIYSICKASGISINELHRLRKAKAESNGSFKERIYLLNTD